MTNICQLLNDLCLGRYYYEAANTLRASLLLSTVLSNSEAWVNLSNKNIEDLEAVDEKFLRSIFSDANVKTPLELLYLETGNIPIRFILKSRRINFLHYILNDKDNSLLSSIFRAQCNQPVKGDWITTVREDIKELDINLTFEQIKSFSKEAFKEKVKNHVKSSALKFLQNLQQTHSKSKPCVYTKLELQDYLKADNDMTRKEKAFTFHLRSRMLDLKCNFKSLHKDLKCRLCDNHEENQEGLMICLALKDKDETFSGSYSDIFSQDKNKITNTAVVLKKKFEKFQHLQVHGQVIIIIDQPSAAASANIDINDQGNPVTNVDISYADMD